MEKSDIKSKLDRSGFVFTDLDSGVRITARGPQSPGGDIGAKTYVKAQRNGSVLDSRECASNGHAASVYVQYVEEYR
jgi:hypothetical protein